jgi:uncharacterized glyoxalase superfamily protein PhnB
MARFYPTLVSDKMVSTINFYEDFFGFVPMVEQDGYALLQSMADPETCIAVFAADHKCVAQLHQCVSGLIITIAVDNIDDVYNELYMEGLELYKEFGVDVHGDRHFVVYDPNGILVNVTEGKRQMQLLAA